MKQFEIFAILGVIILGLLSMNLVSAELWNGASTDQLISWWSMDNDYLDQTTAGRDMVEAGSVPFVDSYTPHYKQAVNFTENAANYLLYNAAFPRPSSGNGTIEMWLRLNGSVTATDVALHMDSDGADANNVLFSFGATSLTTGQWLTDGDNLISYDYADYAQESWQHYALTWNDSVIALYLNGTMVDSTARVAVGEFNGAFRSLSIGQYYSVGPNHPFNGEIDEVMIFNVSRTALEIISDMELPAQKIPILFESSSFNATTYEGLTDGYWINFTVNNSLVNSINDVKFTYDGTEYGPTFSNNSNSLTAFFSGILLPLNVLQAAISNSFLWEVFYTNSTDSARGLNQSNNQTVGPAQFGLCNSTFDISFMNITFKDESTLALLNATVPTSSTTFWLGSPTLNRTNTFSNITANFNYTLCASPEDRTMNVHTVTQYESSGYPQRRYTETRSLSNLTTEKILYLLAQADGIYSIYQVQTENGDSITGVAVTVERQIAGVWTLVESGITDGAGAVTFWLNSNFDHRLTFIKLGFSTLQVTLRPSSSTYTVIMILQDRGAAEYNSSLEGITYSVAPRLTILNPNTNYTFWFNLSSTILTLDGFKFELLDNSSNILATNTSTDPFGNISLYFDTASYKSIRGKYSIKHNGTWIVLDSDSHWSMRSSNISERGTLLAFFKYSANLDIFGSDEGRVEYSKIVFFFTILFLLLGAISFKTGWDFTTTGGSLMLLLPIIWFASFAGFLSISYLPDLQTNIIPAAAMQKHTVALITSFLTFGFILNKLSQGRQ